jgi:HlyD family secretion protein
MKSVIGIVVLAGVVTGLYFLNDLTRTEEGKSVLHVAPELPINVKTATPQQRVIVRTVQAPGEVEPFSEVDISGEVVAKILEMPVEEGDHVTKGELLCRLDDADLQARVTSAEANVAKLKAIITQAEADFEKAERDYRRQLRLIETDSTSNTELADYRTALVRARAFVEIRRQELVEAEAMLQSAQEDLEKTVITAPIDGIVSQLFAKEGEVVITGTMNNPGTRIMVISDLSAMQVRCRVDETDAPLVKTGQVAQIYLQSDTQRAVPGHVLRVATKGTKPQGRDVVTFETLIIVDADDESVRPGMSANVEIEVAQSEDALTIPVEAVAHRKRRDLPEELIRSLDGDTSDPAGVATHARRAAEYLKVVFCIEDDVAHPRLVETGISDARGVEILAGIAAGDRIVTGPFRSLDQLKDGSKVKIEGEPGEKTPADEGEATGEAHAQAGDEPTEEAPAEAASASTQSEQKTESEAEGDMESEAGAETEVATESHAEPGAGTEPAQAVAENR